MAIDSSLGYKYFDFKLLASKGAKITVLAVRCTVADCAAWKAGYGNQGATRQEHGAIPLAVVQLGSLADANAVANDPSLGEDVSEAGVVGPPDVSFRDPRRRDDLC